MTSLVRFPRLLVPLLGATLLSLPALAQSNTRGNSQGNPLTGAREAMWPAPTAEDWSKPCLITWQRTWEDAAAVSKETGRPILVCVNMDGEIASEHYAGVRYRQADIAVLYEPYVTVIASTYRHSPRDHDQDGNRVPCPRFGTVTCGEHITIEPFLFENFFDGKRIAPRHIMVDLAGDEVYDVYYAFDTDSVFATVREGAASYPAGPMVVRGDRPMVERVASRDVHDRMAVENAYRSGDASMRTALIEAAQKHPQAAPVDLLRLGVFGLDVELGGQARGALAASTETGATNLLMDALEAPMDKAERLALIGALERIGKTSDRARTLATVHRSMGETSRDVNIGGWAETLTGGGSYAAPDDDVIAARIEAQDQALDSAGPAELMDLAEAFLEQAYDQYERRGTDEEYASYLLMDARDTALRARQLGASGWRVDAALAVADYYLGDVETAHVHAAAAVSAGIPEDAMGWSAMAVLAIFAQGRQKDIEDAVAARRDWPRQWLADVHAACSVLARHPHGTDAQIVAHYDFLRWLGAHGRSMDVLNTGLARFPSSWELHDRLRRRILERRSITALEAAYDKLLEKPDAAADLHWFAGHASLMTAEVHRHAGRAAQAGEAYGRAIAHFESDIEHDPAARADADHQIALALGGRARLAYEGGQNEGAVSELLASFARSPESASTLDGLNISPVDTAKMLLARLRTEQLTELAGTLERALFDLDASHLRLPAYEGVGPGGSAGN